MKLNKHIKEIIMKQENLKEVKQTAIEWLEDELYIRLDLYGSEQREFDNLIEQAKEMEKQQIIDAISEANKSNNRNVSLNSEQYYNETFNK